jgi:8-oxo-dGTP pyrophosphatase MutT (NUDIX family)
MNTAAIVERDAIRAILMTREHEVLLMRVRPPGTTESFWITPGGGMAAGEPPEDCLRRELREELGLEQLTVGPLVWRRQHTFNWAGRRIRQRERYHVIELEKFVPRMCDPIESKTVDCFRWWSVRELSVTRERLTPLSLTEIVTRYIREGAPHEPLVEEVLVD